MLAGVTGRYFEDNAIAPAVQPGDDQPAGVAAHGLDPRPVDALWEYATAALAWG
jgi:hypothetical protein